MQDRQHQSLTLHFVNFLSPILQDTYEYIVRYIAEQTGCSTQLTTGNTLDELTGEDIHIGFICGLLYAQHAHLSSCSVEPLVAPVLMTPRYQEQPVYFSDVIVHKDSPYISFDDLRGCTWGYNEHASHSGWNLVRNTLHEQGHSLDFFGSTVETGSHQRSIEMVLQKKVDAAAIDSHVLDVFLLRHPELTGKLRVVTMLGPSPIPPVVISKKLDATLKLDIQHLLLTMHHDRKAANALRRSLIKHFVPVTDKDYGDMYRMCALAQEE